MQCADIMGQCRCDNRAEEPPAEPPTCGVTDCCIQRTTPDGLVLCSCFSQAQLDAWGRTCDEHHEFAMISCEPGDACELVDICPSE